MPLPDIPDDQYNEWQAAKFASVASKRVASIGRPPAYIDSSSHQAFINGLLPLAQEWEGRTGIDAGTWLAMAASESNWGKAGTALFGIKGSGNAGSLNSPTWESVNGQRVNQNDNFATYKTAEDAFQGFWDLMQNPRYSSALKILQNGGNGDAFVHEINSAGYATDPNWASSVRSIANTSIAPLVAQATPMGAQANYPQGLNTTSGIGANVAPASGVSPQFPAQTPPAASTGFQPLSTVANAVSGVVKPLSDAVQEIPFEQFAQNLMSTLGASPTPSGGGAEPQRGATPTPDQNVTPEQQDFGSYATSKIASLGYNDMAGVDTTPPPAFGANPQDTTSPIDAARSQPPPPQAPSPSDTFGATPPPLGYNDMAGVNTSPAPAFGANPQDVSSPIAPTVGYTPFLPGPTPIEDAVKNVSTAARGELVRESQGPSIGNLAVKGILAGTDAFGQGIQSNAATNQYAFNPTLGTRADQPARSQVVGGLRILGQFTPEQLAAQQDLGFNAVLGMAGEGLSNVGREGLASVGKAQYLLPGVERDNVLANIAQIKDQLNQYKVIDNPELSARLQRTLQILQDKVGPEAPPVAPPLPPSTDILGDTKKLVTSLQDQIGRATAARDMQLVSDLQTHLASTKKLLSTIEMRNLDASIATENAKGGPVAGRGPGNVEPVTSPVDIARSAVAAATTPEGKRLPIWMQPVSKALSEDPSLLPGAPVRTPLGTRPTGTLPSGRTPGGLGDVRSKPLTVEPAGLATQRALATPQQRFVTRLGARADQFLRESYDRIYPLRELDQLAGLGPNTGSHATAQVVSGAITAGEDNVRRFVMPHIEVVGKDGPALERWWMLQASRDVLAKNPTSRLPGGIDGLGGIQREEALLKQQLGPERFAKVETAAKGLWQANDDLRLQPLRDEGIISKEQYTALKNQYPHYLPFDRYNYSADDPSHLLPRTSSNLSLSSSGIGKRTEGGSTLALDNPMARWMGDVINTQVVISRNKAARSIVNALQDVEKATGQKLVVVAPENAAATAKLSASTLDRGAISYFDPAQPGIKQVANVPKIYETVAKGLEGETGNAFTGLMRALATPLRVGSTSLNIGFLPVNVIRDFQNAYFREGISPVSPYYWQGLKAALAKNSDFSSAARAGALQSGLLESNRSRNVLQRARDLQPIQVTSVKEALLALPRLAAAVPGGILKANEVAEQAPRIATYLKVRGQGLSDLEAAVRARDVTVDFSKSGNFVRMLNQMVPFLNARLQGGVNLIRTAKDNPSQALLHAAPLIMPTVAAWLWNSRFPSSQLIPTYEHDRNYVFQIGETVENVDPRNPNAPRQALPIYIKIPKGDASAVLTAPVDAMMRMAFRQNDRGIVDNFLHAGQAAIQGLAPIDPNANSVISTITPPIAATALSLQSNFDYFRGRDIVPQSEKGRPPELQFGPETSKVADGLGQEFHVSPRLIDFAIRNYTGGLGQNAEWLLDLGLGALGYDPQAPGEVNRQPKTAIENAATLPVASRFLGVRNTELQRIGAQSLQEAVDQTRRTLYENPEVRRFGIGVNPVGNTITYDGRQIPLTPEEQVQFQSLLGQQMKKDLDALPGRDTYRSLKTDALKRRSIQSVMDHARQVVEYQMLHDIGPAQMRQRLQQAS